MAANAIKRLFLDAGLTATMLPDMSADAIYELVGYLGSLFIVTSLTMKSLLKLRLIGLVGSATFIVYGLLIGAIPIAIVNSVIVVIHVYYLRKLLWKRSEIFTVLHVRKESAYLEYFIRFYDDDIRRYIPDFSYEASDDQVRVFTLRDLVPAGLFIANRCADGEMEVKLDFVIPAYRDFKIARYLYSTDSGIFEDPRCDRVWSVATTAIHADYLGKMGFQQDGSGAYSLDLSSRHAPA